MDYKKSAAEYHAKGCNCCQSVVLAFAEELGLDRETVMRMGEAFGLGMGGMQSSCGALSAAMMIAGIKNSDGDPEAPKTKASTYKIARELEEKFRERAGSSICKELKGVETGQVLLPCPACIDLGIELAEELLTRGEGA